MSQFLYKLRNLLVTSGLYFLYLFASCVLTMLVEALLVFFLDKFIIIPYFPLTIIRIVIYSIGVVAILCVLGYAEGYREGKCFIGETILAYIPAMILHLLFAMLFKFQGFVSGSVRFTAGLIANGQSITYDSLINVTPYTMFLAMFFAYAALYLLAFLLAKYFGAQKRIIVRGELRKGEGQTPIDTSSTNAQEDDFYPHVAPQNYDVFYQPPAPVQPAQRLARASLICGIMAFFCAGIPLGIAAIVCGSKAQSLGNTESNAKIGRMCGIIALISGILSLILAPFLGSLIATYLLA